MSSIETKIISALLTAALLLGLFLVIFIRAIIRYKNLNNRLYLEKISAEVRTLENERKRFASNLHDSIGPVLAGIKLQLASLKPEGDSAKRVLSQADGQLDHVIELIRTVSHDLHPANWIDRGLYDSLRDYIGDINASGRFRVQFEASDPPVDLPGDMAIDIFRILQEVICNAMKHSGTGTMHLSIAMLGNRLDIRTMDEGKGFESKNTARYSKGLGLKNIVSRVELMQGKIELTAAPGKGVRYHIQIPVK